MEASVCVRRRKRSERGVVLSCPIRARRGSQFPRGASPRLAGARRYSRTVSGSARVAGAAPGAHREEELSQFPRGASPRFAGARRYFHTLSGGASLLGSRIPPPGGGRGRTRRKQRIRGPEIEQALILRTTSWGAVGLGLGSGGWGSGLGSRYPPFLPSTPGWNENPPPVNLLTFSWPKAVASRPARL